MNGFKSQQHRWTKGSVQTCKKLLPTIWRSHLPFPIKLEATGHLMSNFAYLLLACLCVLLHPSVRGASRRLAAYVPDRYSDLPRGIGVGGGFYICAQRELHPRTWMKEILFLPCLLAFGNRSLAQQRASRSGSALQSQIRFHAHAQVWHRTQGRRRGAAANTGRSNQRFRWPNWLSRSISRTS